MKATIAESLKHKEIVHVKDVSLSHNSEPVLEHIDLKIYSGDYLSIIGPNGAGKSSLIKIILGLIKPTKGTVYLFGKKIDRFSDWKRVGYVPQKATNFDQNFPSTVEEIVGMGIIATKRFPKFLTNEDKADIDEYLKKVGMYDLRKRRIGELSGGQQQRVFIARTLITQPELLILDEPTTGVDVSTQESFYNMLGDLNKDSKITIVIISHDISYVTKYVNKVACLNQRLLFHGTHKEFCSSNIADKILGHDKHFVCHTV